MFSFFLCNNIELKRNTSDVLTKIALDNRIKPQ